MQKIEFENNNVKANDLNSDANQEESALFPTQENKNIPTKSHNDRLVDSLSDSETVEIEKLLRSKDMLVKDSSLGPEFANDYGRIKRPLLSNAFGKTSSLLEKGNLILVTSSIPGEGKTHTSINLALSIALERDHSVLLIDCDSTRHGTSSTLNIRDNTGLVELLDNKDLTIEDVILKTDIDDLFLMSSGKHHDFVTELFASQRMSALITELTDRLKDYVIILDAPPLLPTPVTQVLCELVGQIVFVIEAGKTPQSVVEEALSMIPEGHATGLVMNKCEGISGRSTYYYGYYSEK